MKILFLSIAIFSSGLIGAQNSKYPVKGEPASVFQWGSLSLWLDNDFFNETKDSIVAQIGIEEFEWMKSHCSTAGWPKGLYLSSLDEAEDKAYEERLERLKKYRIASFRHIYHGTVYDQYVILRIPYEENRKWEDTIEWDKSVYFIIKEEDIRMASH